MQFAKHRFNDGGHRSSTLKLLVEEKPYSVLPFSGVAVSSRLKFSILNQGTFPVVQ